MKLKHLFSKHIQVAGGLSIPVSRHFHHSTFGVCSRHDTIARTGNYVCSGTPGTGFFYWKCDSHSYHLFIRDQRKRLKYSFRTLLLGKEPNFDKEIKRVELALEQSVDVDKSHLLSFYLNLLSLAKEEEMLQRVLNGIKSLGHGKRSTYKGIIAHCKRNIATLEHDAAAAQVNIHDVLDDAQYNAWIHLVDAFSAMSESRRVWSAYIEDGKEWYEQVFFDKGVFCYIQMPGDTPIMRDHKQQHYYLYPSGIIRSRTSTDFDFFDWRDIHVQYNPLDINAMAGYSGFSSLQKNKKKEKRQDAMTALYGYTHGTVVGELLIPELNLRFLVNRVQPVEDFVRAIDAYMQTR